MKFFPCNLFMEILQVICDSDVKKTTTLLPLPNQFLLASLFAAFSSSRARSLCVSAGEKKPTIANSLQVCECIVRGNPFISLKRGRVQCGCCFGLYWLHQWTCPCTPFNFCSAAIVDACYLYNFATLCWTIHIE